MDDTAIGRRVAYWRRRRHLSQRVFADRIGRSKSWVEKVEKGARGLDRFSVIQRIADEIPVDVAVLLGTAAPHAATGVGDNDTAEVAAIREALEHYTWPDDSQPSPAVDLDRLSAALTHARTAYQRAAYDTVATVVPDIVRDTQALGRCGGRHRATLLRLRCEAHLLTAALLFKLEAYPLAWLAADRAVGAAQALTAGCAAATGEPPSHPGEHDAGVLAAAAAACVGVCLLRGGQPEAAERVCLTRAQAMIRAARTARPASHERVAAVGVLLSVSLAAAAAMGERERREGLRAALGRRAHAIGADTEIWPFSFGPTSLLIDDVALAVDAGDGPAALRAHRGIPAAALQELPPRRRWEYLLTLAQARLLTGDASGAGPALVQAQRFAPRELHTPTGGRLLTDLLDADGPTLPPDVLALVQRFTQAGHDVPHRAGAAALAGTVPGQRAQPQGVRA